ncbi:MAG: hypothetical protein ACYDHY_12965 [Acidiferrobacterales bacterium]
MPVSLWKKTWLLVLLWQTAGIATARPMTNDPPRLFSETYQALRVTERAGAAAWSPDGTQLAISGWKNHFPTLTVVNVRTHSVIKDLVAPDRKSTLGACRT